MLFLIRMKYASKKFALPLIVLNIVLKIILEGDPDSGIDVLGEYSNLQRSLERRTPISGQMGMSIALKRDTYLRNTS